MQIPDPIDPEVVLRQWVLARPWARWLGIGLRVLGSLGTVFVVAVMIATPILTSRSIPSVQSGLRSGAGTVGSLADSLELAGRALGSAAEVLEGTGDALSTVERSIANTQPLIESVAGLVGSTVPVTIEGTQATLEAAVTGAQAIDQVLRGLAALSPITGVSYDPEQTLEASLSEAAAGLAPIPEALRDIQGELEQVGSEMEAMRQRLRSTSADLERFAGDLRQVERDLGERVEDLRELAAGLDRAAESADVWMWGVVLVLELILIGVAATQLTLYVVGRELTASGPEEQA